MGAVMETFLYQYIVGGFVFLVGVLVAFRQGSLSWTGHGGRWLAILVAGLLFFAGIQGFLQFAPMSEAPAVPYAGGYQPKDQLGTPLDYAVMVAYFIGIVIVGTMFSGGKGGTKDFFFGGQRFAWWLIAFSLAASVVGSYSFVKYSQIAYNHGIASTQTYLNDWFWLPLVLFGWLPILYFGRLTSIPEYFEKRFSVSARRVVTALLLVYLVGYIGINLFTMGKALNQLLGWSIFWSAALVACVSAAYVTFGGQTAVIMTDLFQGLMLLGAGLVLLALGAAELGGFDMLWDHLPRGHRLAFPDFNADPDYPGVGIFWQDAMANSAMFFFLNQGILMRFMAARSVEEGRKAAVAVMVILMPVAAIVVASGGWVGRAFVHAGLLPDTIEGGRVFFVVGEMLAVPGVFGLILAALVAALMSTVDTLVTAVAAVVVNDVVRPMRPDFSDQQLLLAARITSISVTIVGVALVTVFQQFDTIYAAHSAFTAAISPPMVVALLMGVFWRRYTPAAALATMIGGSALIVLSIVFPQIITPIAHGVPMVELGPDEGLLGGMKQYKFMRALFGLLVSVGLGVVVTFFTTPRPLDEVKGWVWGTIPDAIRTYKGKEGTESASAFVAAALQTDLEDQAGGPGDLPTAVVSSALATSIEAEVGDLLFVSDRRWWFGGLHATHVRVREIVGGDAAWVRLGPDAREAVVRPGRESEAVVVQRLY
jgi:solute:Na+ symporter, SSS family